MKNDFSRTKHRPLLAAIIPGWAKSYQRRHLTGDLVAGLTTAIMLVPQGMAYAMLAGLPPIVGLYASALPLLVYALVGTSRQLAVGPVAMVSLLVAAGVSAAVPEGADVVTFVSMAALLALMVGAMQMAMGVFRLGFLVNFLSHPVVSGFTSAAALIIGLSQLKYLLGIDIPRSHHVHTIILAAIEHLRDVNGTTFAIGLASIGVLLLAKKKAPRFPMALLVVATSTVGVWLLNLSAVGVAIVKDVPAGLPSFTVPSIDLASLSALFPVAVAISLVGFMESISVAKTFARKHRYDLDANRELVALGSANVAAAFFGGYPVTGGFSRTAVNDQAGSKTPLASVVTALLIALTLLFLTPLFFFLPKAVLASIIMVAVFGLIDLREVKHLWQVSKPDLGLLALTFFATLGLGIEQGIGIGVGTSLFAFVVRTTRPHYAVLGRLEGTTLFKNVERFANASRVPGILALRFDAQFYFGNVTFLKETLNKHLAAEPQTHTVILDATSVNRLDSSADAALRELHEDLSDSGIDLFIAGAKGPVLDFLERSGLRKRLGSDHLPLTVDEAVRTSQRAHLSPMRDAA